MMTTTEAIKKALLLITASHNREPTKSLLTAWCAALNDLTIDQIEAAALFCIKERDNAFMPTTAEFIKIAQTLVKDEKRKERLAIEAAAVKSVNLTFNESGFKKIKRFAAKIGENSATPPKPPKVTILEYFNRHGEVASYQAAGWIDFGLFEKECLNQYSAIPWKIEHIFQAVHKFNASPDQEPRYATGLEACRKSDPFKQKFTIGRV